MSATKPALLTPDDVAARWSIPRRHVLELARRKQVASIKVGRYVRFEQAAVERYEAKQRAEAA
ncbi:helix-turn-helix domain-containing protein [Microbacterium oryzae]|uniref:helix-turn-helix domain-containing protein n=1 Tax=Microbacterium oryzae TaxID=743009 RepID=UPI0025B0E66B|nr:helix-turn-helix domain-containing protein [Microbacterium oryzae]MDN3309594.1 helix-turn-helix domain-containing protein [Microbacterium oryzae]